MNVRNEINKFADEADKPVLHWLLDKYHMQSQWRFVAKCTHQRYGTQSYQTKCVWSPTEEGRALYHYMTMPNTSLTTQQANEGPARGYDVDGVLARRALSPFIADTPTAATDAQEAWKTLCAEQGWTEATPIMRLEGFLAAHGLLGTFVTYARQAAALGA